MFLGVGSDNSRTYMFLIDVPFKGDQDHSNRSSIVHAFLIFFAYHRRFAYDFHFLKLFENLIVHTESMTPHETMHPVSMYRVCGVNDTACILKNSNLIRGPGRMF
jgi:hypothetical protein